MKHLDRWWSGIASGGHRLDREPYHLCVLLVFLCFSASLIAIGPVPNSSLSELSPNMQDALALFMFLGSALSLTGVAVGAPIVPSVDRRNCYRLGILGAPLVTTSAWVLGGATIIGVESWSSALAAVAPPLLGLAVAVQAALFWLEIRRLDRAVALRNGNSP